MFSDLWIRELKPTEVKNLTEGHQKLLNDKTRLAANSAVPPARSSPPTRALANELEPTGRWSSDSAVLTLSWSPFCVALDEHVDSMCQREWQTR